MVAGEVEEADMHCSPVEGGREGGRAVVVGEQADLMKGCKRHAIIAGKRTS